MPERIDTKVVLADCLPPNPANYKSDFQCMTIAIKRLEAIRGALAQEIGDREALEESLRLARQHVAVDEQLLAERDRLLDAIPECAAHGNRCVPNAIEWVLASIDLEKAADALLEWFTKGVDCLPPGDLRQNLRAARQGGPTWEEEHTALAGNGKRA